MRFAGRIVDDGRSYGEGCGAEAIFGRGDRSFIKKDVGPAELFCLNLQAILCVADLGAKGSEDLKMSIKASPSDSIATRAWQGNFSCAGEEGASQSDRASEARA